MHVVGLWEEASTPWEPMQTQEEHKMPLLGGLVFTLDNLSLLSVPSLILEQEHRFDT